MIWVWTLIYFDDIWYVIEAKMKYDQKGVKIKNMDLKQLIRRKLLSGELSTSPAPCSKESDNPEK